MTDMPATPDADSGRITPMMEQYIEIKAANPDCLLFYRMGDFYELFFDDAVAASRTLGITLTKRGKHLGADIPMAGVPVHAADDYLQRLIEHGHRVAVCEQVEDPAEARKRGAKSVVKRDVVRLVTPGTLTEDRLLEARRNNYLLAIARARLSSVDDSASFALAWLDMSTGEFRLTETDPLRLPAEIARIDASEIIVADSLYEEPELLPFWRELKIVVPMPKELFDGAQAEKRIAAFYGVRTLDGFGSFSRLELIAAGAAVTYLDRTQVGKKPALSPPVRDRPDSVMVIDPATRANLELLRTMGGERKGSLLSVIDATVTAAGARTLGSRLANPSTDLKLIESRLDAVALLAAESGLRADIRSQLAAAPDMARALARLSLGRGGPRDLAAIAQGLTAAEAVTILLQGNGAGEIGAVITGLSASDMALPFLLREALDDDLPLLKRDGGFVRAGFRPELDEARALRNESRQVIASLQGQYAESSGVKSLKIKHNNVLGYFIEVAQQYGDAFLKPPLNADFIHRQTLAGVMRFSTTELSTLEARIAGAADRALAIELEVFAQLESEVLMVAETLRRAAEALAILDCHAALADLAVRQDYCCPLLDDSVNFAITGGRHPVVEASLGARDDFIANGCDLSPPVGQEAGRIWLITGPNMAGKSTFLRQNALIAILAQMGSFVPATSAHIGVVDRLFSRVGAADDLARGRSTFMVEMVETAAILNQAGRRSLVILDEIGRGTSTFDGLSIAWAAVEHLHNVNGCRALFATHFHELTALSAKLTRLANATVAVKEWEHEVIFLHEVIAGAADRSYGIQVARLAGLPSAVLERARHILSELEATDRAAPVRKVIDDLPLFAAAPRPAPPPAARSEPALESLDSLDPDAMTPREALEALYRLKALRH